MHLAQIWTYPVKSMKGVVIESAQLQELGVVGDRRWALRDLERGNLANCRQTPGIMSLAASAAHDSPEDHVVITLDDHRTVTSSDPSVHEVLSQALGRQVQLVPLAPRDDLDFFRRKPASQPPVDPMAELRGIFGRESDEPLPDFAKFGAGVLEFESPPGTFHDCFPLMVMTTSALQSMTHAVPGSVIDVRRFRPSFVVDTGDEPGHPEFSWAGRRFAVGTAVIEVVNDCPRCAAITKQVGPDVPADRDILRHVVRDLGQAVGVYCNVVQSGSIATGDAFTPLP
jgi:uncharacterized protein YcbX